MKPNTPPTVTTDPQGKILNFSEVARWAYIHDPAFRNAENYSDLHHESYVAKLERLVLAMVISKQELLSSLTIEKLEPKLVLYDSMLTVTSPADDHDLTIDEAQAVSLILTLMIAAVSVIALALAAWGVMQGHWTYALTGAAIAGAGAGYLAWKGGSKP